MIWTALCNGLTILRSPPNRGHVVISAESLGIFHVRRRLLYSHTVGLSNRRIETVRDGFPSYGFPPPPYVGLFQNDYYSTSYHLGITTLSDYHSSLCSVALWRLRLYIHPLNCSFTTTHYRSPLHILQISMSCENDNIAQNIYATPLLLTVLATILRAIQL